MQIAALTPKSNLFKESKSGFGCRSHLRMAFPLELFRSDTKVTYNCE